MQVQDGGAGVFSKLVGPQHADYELFYAELFRRVFQSAQPIATLVKERMKNYVLQPGEYAVAHYRAFHAIEDNKERMSKKQSAYRAINAVNCASTLLPGHPIYFASHSFFALDAIRLYAEEKNGSIATNQNPEEALHLDKASRGDQYLAPSEFYEIFVNHLSMASARCVSNGVGGFGKFAQLLSYVPKCSDRHFDKGRPQKCQWQVP